MTNVQFPSIEDYNDVATKNLFLTEIQNGKTHEEMMNIIWRNSRDNSRTPIKWNAQKHAGFTTAEEPWMKINPNYQEVNMEKAIAEADSLYSYYKKLIELRKEYPVAVYGAYDLVLEDHEHVYAYTRTLEGDALLIVANLFLAETELELPMPLVLSLIHI